MADALRPWLTRGVRGGMPMQSMGRIMPARFEDSPIQPATVGAGLAREAAAPIFLTLRAVNFAGKPRSNRFCVLIVPTLRVVMQRRTLCVPG